MFVKLYRKENEAMVPCVYRNIDRIKSFDLRITKVNGEDFYKIYSGDLEDDVDPKYISWDTYRKLVRKEIIL